MNRKYSSGDVCSCGEICLHQMDARKRAKHDAGPGYHYKALPCRKTTWWHVYVIKHKKPTRAERKRIQRSDADLRRRLEGGDAL